MWGGAKTGFCARVPLAEAPIAEMKQPSRVPANFVLAYAYRSRNPVFPAY